jgi:hypothetical protein
MPQESKSEQIDRVKANLPLPEQPPAASDWQSADARNVNVGSGGVSTGDKDSSVGLREPATQGSDAEEMDKIGRENKSH